MATVDIALATANGRSGKTKFAVLDSAMVDADVITLSGVSQQSDFAVPGTRSGDYFWVITAIDGNLRIQFGANPTATAGEGGGWLILWGQTREFTATGGDKCAVISA